MLILGTAWLLKEAPMTNSVSYADGPTMVTCYPDENCGCTGDLVAMESCCDNSVMPLGYSYQIRGQGECYVCPVGQLDSITPRVMVYIQPSKLSLPKGS